MAASVSLDGTEAAGARVALAQVERSALRVLAARVGAAGCAYIAQVLMARLMGGSEYGVFATIWVWIAILGHASTWGLGQTASRFVPAYRASGDLASARGFLAGGAVFALASGALTALAGAAAVWAFRDTIGPGHAAPFLLAFLVIPFFALQDYAEGVARSFDWPLLAIAPPYLLRQALIMGAMTIAVLLGAPPEAWVAVASTLVATALSLALQATVLLRRIAIAMPRGPGTSRWRQWGTAALPIALVDLAGSGFTFVDVLVLGLVMPPAAVGAYFAATRIQQFVVFVQFAASAATLQHFAAAEARGDRAALEALVRRRARLSTVATLVVGGVVLAASPFLFALFGPDFRGGVPILAVLVAGSLVQSALGPGDDLLTMLGEERVCALVSCGMVAVAAGLVLALAPLLGTLGAAVAMALAGSARAAILAAVVRARLGIATTVFARQAGPCPA